MSGSNDHIDENAQCYGDATIAGAAKRLLDGGLVAVPTETVYGLAADATNARAVAEIYRTKGRPDFNPLIVHVQDLKTARELARFNPLAQKLAKAFWPGPLTLVVPKTDDCAVAPAVTAGLDTIALRCPAHPVMRALLEKSGLFLAAPSANRSSGISPTTAAHVRRSLGDATPMILDGGACASGLESTIVGIVGDGYRILRPGPVTAEILTAAVGKKPVPATDIIVAPGQLALHYAPSKPVRLNVVAAKGDEYHIGFGDIAGHQNLSPACDLAEAASHLFACLHIADASKFPSIAVAPIPDNGIGAAINDRLKRAAHR